MTPISFALISFALLAAPTLTAQAQPFVLRYGQIPSTVHGISSLPLYIAQKRGLFAREGIAVQLRQIPGGTDQMVAALDRGDVDLAQSATPYLVKAALAGSDAIAIAGSIANPLYSLIAKPPIKTFADLKGRTIGLSLPIDTISISTRKLLALNGLAPGDYRVKALVGTPLRARCLQQGECEAVPLGQPDDLLAVKAGFTRLGVSTDAVPKFQFEVIAVRRAFAREHAGAMVHFVRALADAFRFIHDPANRPDVERAVVALTGVSDEVAGATLALYFEPDRGVLPKQAEINLDGLAQVIAFMGEAGVVKPPLPAPGRFIDLDYLHAAAVQ